MISIEQIRAGRALLDWSQSQLAEKAGLSQTGIARLENGTHKPNQSTLDKIHTAFLAAGLEFIDDGVRRARERLITFHGEKAYQTLMDDIYDTLRNTDAKEVRLINVKEFENEDDPHYKYTLKQIKRVRELGAKEYILAEEGMQEFLSKSESYRWIPSRFFQPFAVYIYGSRVGFIDRAETIKVIVLDNEYFAQTLRSFFDFAWMHANKAG